MAYKVRKKDFRTFVDLFKKYSTHLGITGWEMYFYHTPLSDDVVSNVYGELPSRQVSIRLNKKSAVPPTHSVLDNIARHEALELFMLRLSEKAQDRYTTCDDIQEARHEIIQKLMNSSIFDGAIK